MSVRSHRSFRENSNLYVVGEVVNLTSAPAFMVKVLARFHNADGRLLDTAEAFTYLAQTMPGQRNPFKLHLANAPDDIERYELTLSWDDISIIDYQRITVLGHETRDNGGLEVFGELRNDHPNTMGAIQVVAAFYDAAGEVVDIYPGSVGSTTLAPGATSPYTVSTFRQNLTYHSLAVQAQGRRVP